MSSNRYQIVKKSRKFQMNPESSGEQVVSSMKVQTFGSTRTGGADNFAISSQGASASGKREMNLVSSGNSGDGILFSGRGYPHLRKDLDSVQTLTVHADHTILEPKTQTLNKSLRLLELTTDLEAHHPMEEKEVPE